MKTKNAGKLNRKNLPFYIIPLLIICTVLITFNTLDFDSFFESDNNSPSDETQTVVTYKDEVFYTPVYDENIFLDEAYTDKNMNMLYTVSNETFTITKDTPDKDDICVFFTDFFDSLKSGDSDAYNSLFTNNYLNDNGRQKAFAPQKVFDIRLTVISSAEIEEGVYAGVTRYIIDLNYCIFHNNGTFRKDISEDETHTQRIELLKYSNGKTLINRIDFMRYINSSEINPSLSLFEMIMPIIWLVLTLALAIIALITKKAKLIPGCITVLASFVLSFAKFNPFLQLAVFAVITCLSTLLFVMIAKKYRVVTKPDCDNDGESTGDDGENNQNNEADKETQNV